MTIKRSTNRVVGPQNINQSFAGILRISPNNGKDMGFEDTNGDYLNNDYGEYAGTLPRVSDSKGTFSCLSLGVQAMKVDGILTLASDYNGAILDVQGMAHMQSLSVDDTITTKDLRVSGDLYADGKVYLNADSLVFKREFPTGDDMYWSFPTTGMYNGCVLTVVDGNPAWVPFVDLYNACVVDNNEGVESVQYVMQDKENTVRKISVVDKYPSEPEPGCLYLLNSQFIG